MSAEVIRSLVPFGIAGLAIVALITIAATRNMYVAAGAMCLVVAIVVLDKVFPAPRAGQLGDLKKVPDRAAGAPPVANPVQVAWVDTGLSADWGGRDYAYTITSKPKYKVQDTELCEPGKIGYVATCWESRASGYPPNVTVTDVPSGTSPAQWCTYKNNEITLAKAPEDGLAPRGRVYICAQSVPRSS